MFIGESTHSLDAKNRVFVPKRFQEDLERDADGHRTAILTRGFEGCLFLFAAARFEEVVRRLRTEAFDGARERRMQRLFFAKSHRAQLDGSGRVLIPENLKELVGIEKEIVMVGLIDRIELWPRAAWEAFESTSSKEFDELDRVLCSNAPEGPESS